MKRWDRNILHQQMKNSNTHGDTQEYVPILTCCLTSIRISIIKTRRLFFPYSGILYTKKMSLTLQGVGTLMWHQDIPDSKVHGTNMGPTWVLSVPDGTHVGPMNLAIRDVFSSTTALRIYASLDQDRSVLCLNLEHHFGLYMPFTEKHLKHRVGISYRLPTRGNIDPEALTAKSPSQLVEWESHSECHG